MNYYVIRPDLTPYEGLVVKKDTKIEYKNEKVKQKLENLKLITESEIYTERYNSKTFLEIKL